MSYTPKTPRLIRRCAAWGERSDAMRSDSERALCECLTASCPSLFRLRTPFGAGLPPTRAEALAGRMAIDIAFAFSPKRLERMNARCVSRSCDTIARARRAEPPRDVRACATERSLSTLCSEDSACSSEVLAPKSW